MALSKDARQPQKRHVEICIGDSALTVGDLTWVKDGNREYSTFAYREGWLRNPSRFKVSPDLELVTYFQVRKAPTKEDSCFPFALADTQPDSWGRRVIARASAKERGLNPGLGVLTEMDYLCAVDDFSRVGALRLRDENGGFLRTTRPDERTTPPLVDLKLIYEASRAVESGNESLDDLRYLQGKGTSLGGMRPKCTVLDDDGSLAIGKFPSVHDERAVTRGEVLAMRLAALAGIEVAHARVVVIEDVPVAVIKRFDRAVGTGRIHYLSASSLLQANRGEERTYTELVDAMRRVCLDAQADARQLWRRLAFNLLITNIDDHLHNTGFLYAGNGLWRLSPAFDLNPFPDKHRESKTWLSEDTGPLTSVETLLDKARYFHLSRDAAVTVLAEVVTAVSRWRWLAAKQEIAFTVQDIKDFEPAFDHGEMEKARVLVGCPRP